MESRKSTATPGLPPGYGDDASDMVSAYSTECEFLNFVIRISSSMLQDKDQDPTGLGSLQRLEEISKFTFREFIVDPKNQYNLALQKCYVKLQLYEKNIKNFITIHNQTEYSQVLKGLSAQLQTNKYIAFEVRVFLYNLIRDDVSNMSKMTKNSR